MIEKKIHYVWIGGHTLPQKQKDFIAHCRELMPDYEIKIWTDDDFDMQENKYCWEAYQLKKYAFVSDYLRLKILQEEGGIYMDTDVEVVKRFDDLLSEKFVIGFESKWLLETCFLASEKNGTFINECVKIYETKAFHLSDEIFNFETINSSLLKLIVERYKQYYLKNKRYDFNELSIFPMDYFSPKRWQGIIYNTERTYVIHHFNGSWLTNGVNTKKTNLALYKVRQIIKALMFYILGTKKALRIIEKNFVKITKAEEK